MPKNAEGKHFSSKFRMARHEAAHKADQHEANETPEFEAGEQEGAEEGQEPGEGEDIQSIVAQHGPAEEVHIEHDHAAGKHKVTSHHGGHKHVAEHATAEEAHEHAKVAGGVEAGGLGY